MAHRPLAVLFDLDGTLIDSIELLLGSYRHAFRERQHFMPSEAEWIAGIGTPLPAQLRPFASDDDDLQLLIRGYRSYQQQHIERLTRCYAGTPEVLATLRERGHPIALVTSKGDELARRSAEIAGVAGLLDTIVGADSCTRHKPDPEPVHVALGRLGYAPGEAVFVGDSPHDVASGNAAGVATVAALWGPFTREALARANPRHYASCIDDVVPLLERIAGARPAASAGLRGSASGT